MPSSISIWILGNLSFRAEINGIVTIRSPILSWRRSRILFIFGNWFSVLFSGIKVGLLVPSL